MYVGATPTTGDFKKLDSITTSSATTFNLRQGGVAVYPQSANHCIVSLNGVIQAPVDAFTIVNDTIVFASSLASSDVINFILVLGNVNDIGTPSDDSISAAKIQTDAVSQAKIADEAIDEARMQISNAGSNGQFLSKQSGNTGGLTWADAGSQWALISSTTASNTADVEIRGLNDSDYFQFLVVLDRIVPATDDVDFRIFLENSANNNFGAYNFAALGYDEGGDEQRATGANASMITVSGGVGSDSGEEGISGNVIINNPSAQKEPSIQFHVTVMDKDHDIRVIIGSGIVKDDSEDANGIHFDFSSGNIESGTFKLYGLKAS